MAHRTVLLDTSFVIALENRDDPFHQRAQDLDRALAAERATFLLHWGILCEIGDGYSRLGRREKGIEILGKLLGEQGYDVFSISDSLLAAAVRLYRDRVDKDWGLTDCVSFVLMHQEGVTESLTADQHFVQAGFRALLLDAAGGD